MIVPQGESRSDLLAVGAEVGLNLLPQRLQGLEAGATASRMKADTLRRVVVHGDEG